MALAQNCKQHPGEGRKWSTENKIGEKKHLSEVKDHEAFNQEFSNHDHFSDPLCILVE